MRNRTIDNPATGEAENLYPIWATKRTIRELLGLCDKILYLLVADGVVAFVKTGESQQSGALYSFHDVLDWINARAKRNPQKPQEGRASA